jgi:drug/metabolite transporter (DMT)-like permease
MSANKETSGASLPLMGFLVVLLVCLLWGGSIPFIRVSEGGLPPLLMATGRMVLATFLLWVYTRFLKEPVFLPRPYFWHGVILGILFGLTMLFLYLGLVLTNAARGTIFYSTKPFWVAIGAHFLVSERLSLRKIAGLLVALAGVYFAFLGPSVSAPAPDTGNLMEIVAALFFSSTALLTKWLSNREKLNHYQTLFTMMLFSIPLLFIFSMIFEWGYPIKPNAIDLLGFGYQSLGTQFVAYILWFWLIHRYSVSQVASFTFLVPLVGVILSALFLGERTPDTLWLGLALVGAGIVMVNWPKGVQKGS